MDPEHQRRLKELFQSFLEISPDKRAAFLDETCGDDSALRSDLESLIAESVPGAEALRPGIPSTFPTGAKDLIGQKIGRYVIKDAIGAGGMGMIYKAEDTRLGRSVALKFLTPLLHEQEQAKARFFQEARAAAVLDHQNICTVYEIDEQEGQTFIAMAFIEGQSLKERLVSGPLDFKESLDIVIQTAQGLQAAHEKGIIHRDIKPGNIMITSQGQPKIVDFGLAKLSGQTRVTRTGVALGTVAYMSPEQARGEAVYHRTDIWSLGVVLFEMLTRQQPFKGEDVQSVISAILHEDPPPLTEYLPGLPRGLEETVKRTLAKNPEERYPHLKDMLVDLRLLRHDPDCRITIKRPSDFKAYPSIAVLPFRNMSADPDQEYFCEGMAEEIINALSKLERLRVVARTSSFAFKGEKVDIREIGEKLNVETVLEGSVLKANNRVRITAQLINVSDSYHLWSDRFDREMEDIFAIHDEITMAIVDELKVKLLDGDKARLLKPRKEDPEAYQLYLRGRYFFFKLDYEKGMKYFHEALEKDPNYALPYTGIADNYFGLGLFKILPAHDVFQKAKAAAERAQDLDPSLGEAHVAVANIKWNHDWDFKGAEKEYRQAIELNPSWSQSHSWFGIYLALMGRHGEAISEASRGVELDRLSVLASACLGLVFFAARQDDRAFEELQKAREMDPSSYSIYLYLARIYQDWGMYDEAIDAANKVPELVPVHYMDSNLWFLSGYIHGMMGRRAEAEKTLEEMYEASRRGYFPSLDIAIMHIGLGQYDQAFEWLEKAYEERDHLISWGKIMSLYDPLQSDPRYALLMKKIGLEP